MRLAAFLLMTALLLVSTNSFSQRITISQKNIPLTKVFLSIQHQSGFSFLYDNKLIKQANNIDINLQNASVEEALEYCLKDLPLTYIITDKIIVIKEKLKQKAAATNFQIIKGVAQDEKGNPLIGASVYIQELKRGTQTNESGAFSFDNVAPGAYTLEISFVGFIVTRKTIIVDANAENFYVTLKQADNNLVEIAITALGISRKTRTLPYSIQTISNEDFTTIKNNNVLNSLNGKVAGIQVNRVSGGAGGSVRIVLRGDKSTRSSQPLYVVDGLPIANPTGGPNAGLYNGSPDAGDILSTINPDDMENLTILKGASASALYGSQGSNGVILINTKKGKSGISKIDFSSSITFDNVSILPKLQYDYNQSTASDATSPGSEDSWGSKDDTKPGKDYMENFFQTGVNFINSINFSSSNERSSNYLSYSNTNNKGILPTSTFKQNTLGFRQNCKFLNDKLTFDGSFLGTIQEVRNRLTPGIYFNPLTGLYLFPRGQDFNSFKSYEYFSPSRYLNAQNWWNINYDKGFTGQDYQQNPFWVLNRNPIENRNQNVYVSASLKYVLNDWLIMQARGNINNFVNEYQRNIYASTQATLAKFNGNLSVNKSNNTTLYGDLMLMGDKKLNSDWKLNFTLGTSIQDQKGKAISINGTPTVPNVFLESALDLTNTDIRNNAVSKQIQSVFGSVQVSYKNKVFVDLADRNDWSSTLAFTPFEKKGYNYYSVGTSIVLSELLHLPAAVNFARLRASYAIVGNDIAAFSSYPLYTFSNGGIANPPVSNPINIPGYYLQPEKNKSLEIGTQWNLLQKRLSLDVTWYKTNIINQYFQNIAVPPGIGTGGVADINGGNIQNMGIELSVSYKVINARPFAWTTTVNFSHNKNKIVKLFNSQIITNPSPDQMYHLSGRIGGGFEGVLKQGGSYGDMYSRAFKRDTEGHIVVNLSTGIPYFTDEIFLGNPNPTFILGWNNAFVIKDFVLSFLLDGKFGGKVLSITEAFLDQMGVSKRTGDIRDNGGTIKIENAVDENGHVWKGVTDAQTYYKAISGKSPVAEAYMYSATAIRLRELSLAYCLPFKSQTVKELRLGLIGSNLFFFTRKAPFDPEQVAGVNPGGVGVDTFGLPSFRSMGFSIKCAF